MLPCQKTYECSTENSKVTECLEDGCNLHKSNNRTSPELFEHGTFVKTQSNDIIKISKNILTLC